MLASVMNLRVTNGARDPDVDTCLAHLKLLHAIHNMKEEVGYTDGLFGLWDSRASGTHFLVESENEVKEQPYYSTQEMPLEDRKRYLSRIREKRWALFVARAVDRYEATWNLQFKPTLTEDNSNIPDMFSNFPYTGKPLKWDNWMMPPLGKLCSLRPLV